MRPLRRRRRLLLALELDGPERLLARRRGRCLELRHLCRNHLLAERLHELAEADDPMYQVPNRPLLSSGLRAYLPWTAYSSELDAS